MEDVTLAETIKEAHIYEGNRQDAVPFSNGSFTTNDLQVDDPMDLLVT